MNKIKYVIAIGVAALLAAFSIQAQTQANTISASTITSLLNDGLIKIGVPTTINGVTFVVSTNVTGGYLFSVSSPNGALEFTPPTTEAGALNQAGQWIGANNPTNASYYGTNDITIRLGADYLQDSGTALIDIGVEKYGLIKSQPNLYVAGDLYQGTKSGVQSTAAFDAKIGYRKVIGDVAAGFDVGAGYDLWSGEGYVTGNVKVEYRQNAHLGEFVQLGYNQEFGHSGDSSGINVGGLGVKGGITYTF